MTDFPRVSDEEKQIARFLETRFGGRPRFFVHREAPDDEFYVAVAVKDDYPGADLVTCATNGISNYPLYNDDGSVYADTRLELVATCRSGQEGGLREMLFFSGRTVVKQRWLCAPGVFLLGAVSRFGAFGDMEHLYFTTPFAQEGFESTVFGERRVSWLAAIPVSTAEMNFAREKSTEALEDLFVEKDVDWENLQRRSAV
jgi:antitoxin YqcF